MVDNADHTAVGLPLEVTSVPQWVWKKAEIEINETEEIRQETLKKLKRKLQEDCSLRSDLDDYFLLRFLRARKFDWRRAYALVKSYYKHRVNFPDLYEDYSAESVQHVADNNLIGHLPYRTSSGCPIFISFFGRWNPDEYPFQDTVKFGRLSLEEVSQCPMTQICGVINVIDLRGFSWNHLSHISLKDIQCLISGVQESFPLRQKVTHIVNNPPIFSMLFFAIRPLLSNKMKKRIFFHGYDLKSLHQHISPSLLPVDLGGELPEFRSQNFYNLLVRDSKKFEMIKNFGYVS